MDLATRGRGDAVLEGSGMNREADPGDAARRGPGDEGGA
jgi:hypothetical protein